MGLGGPLRAFLCSFFIVFGAEYVQVHLELSERRVVRVGSYSDDMPLAWEKRLVQVTSSSGQEVLLLRKAVESGYWLVATATEGICKIELNDKTSVRTPVQGPAFGVAYSPVPKMTTEARKAVMEQADNRFASGTGGVRILRFSPENFGRALRRYIAIAASMPITCFRAVRWCFRKPDRIVGLFGFIWILVEVFRHLGAYTWMEAKSTFLYERFQQAVDAFTSTSEYAMEWKKSMEDLHSTVSDVVTPWRIPAYLVALVSLKKLWFEAERSETPMSTPARSSRATPESPSTPVETTPGLKKISEAVLSQREVMSQLYIKMQDIENRNIEKEAEDVTIRDARASAMNDKLNEALSRQQLNMDAMQAKMISLEKKGTVIEDPVTPRTKAGGVDGAVAETPPPVVEGVQQILDACGADPYHENKILVAKLKADSRPANEIFLEALKYLKNEDEHWWATHFPQGQRKRCAPHLLGNLYAKHKDLCTWAKDYLREKNIGDCPEASGLLPACASLDGTFLTDRVPDAINFVITERLARQIWGIQCAFLHVREKNDWMKPSNPKGNWVTKVDHEVWRRTDPEREGLPTIYINREVEDELRSEMERDARIRRANINLAGPTR